MEVNAKALLTDEIRMLVAKYLCAKVHAETMRSKVDKIQRAILADSIELVNEETGERITEPSRTLLCEDSAFLAYDAECSRRERACGLKPADMPDSHCPALVAEESRMNAENALLDAAGAALDVEDISLKLLCMENGLGRRKEFIELVAKLVLAAERDGIAA